MFGDIAKYVQIATALLEAVVELAKLTRENTAEVKRNNQLLAESKAEKGTDNA